jgi:hypothetical protein
VSRLAPLCRAWRHCVAPGANDVLFYILLQIVFGTGDKLQAITVTSNGSFIRAAREQVKFCQDFQKILINLYFYFCRKKALLTSTGMNSFLMFIN